MLIGRQTLACRELWRATPFKGGAGENSVNNGFRFAITNQETTAPFLRELHTKQKRVSFFPKYKK